MQRIFLVLGFVILTLSLSSCQTVKGTVDGAVTGMEKDVSNVGGALCITGQTLASAFAPGDANKPRGAVLKADDWIRENLW